MKKITIILLALIASVLTSAAQNAAYKIIYERDTVIKTRVGGFSLSSRPVRRIIYEYPSKDVDGKPVTISGVMMIPSNIIDGTPCVAYSLSTPPTNMKGMATIGLRESWGVLPRVFYNMAGKGAELLYWDSITKYCGVCVAT